MQKIRGFRDRNAFGFFFEFLYFDGTDEAKRHLI